MLKSIFNLGMLLILSSLLIRCTSDSKQSKIDALEQEVMEIHNKLMPRMGELARLKDELEKKKNGLDSLAAEQADLMEDLLLDLSAANEGMLNWMRNYSGDFKQMTQQEIEKYLNEQKSKIEEIQDRIGGAIEAASNELEK